MDTSANNSIADQRESEFISRILADPTWRQVLGMPPGTDPHSVVLAERDLPRDARGRLRGDVDLLIVPPNRPDLSHAVQVKRIKVGERAFVDGRINGLQNFAEGAKQANILVAMGFHAVHLQILIAVDTRSQKPSGREYTRISPNLLQAIREKYDEAMLDPRVGLIECEFTQPFDREPFEVPTVSWNWLRAATVVDQAIAVTEWVASEVARGAI